MATSSTPSPSKSAVTVRVENFAGNVNVLPNCCFINADKDAVSAAGEAAGAFVAACGDCATAHTPTNKTMPMNFMSTVYCLFGSVALELAGRIPISNTLQFMSAL